MVNRVKQLDEWALGILKDAVKRYPGERAELAKRAEMPLPTLQNILLGRVTDPGFSRVTRLCEALGVDIRLIAYGIGAESGDWETWLTELPEGWRRIPVFDIAASAGDGEEVLENDPATWVVVPSIFLPRGFGSASNLQALRVSGDSMEPTLRSGDMVIIDRDQTEARNEEVYVILLEGLLYIKRLRFMSGGKLSLVSSNPAYPPIDIERAVADSFRIKGRVVWVGSWR